MNDIYADIAKRTNGEIYLGVVGPVRTGKSTFIKRFMEGLIIPNISDEFKRERARDELPQSGSGRTIMTAEPKFIPEEAAEIKIGDSAQMKVRMIDCVGYMVDGAIGHLEDDVERMVSTPWFETDVPLSVAAEVGTKKVIDEHSTVGVVITTDGSITEIPRKDYVSAEARVIEELKQIGKPFIVLVNSINPEGEDAQSVVKELSDKYGVTPKAVNCQNVSEEQILDVMKEMLFEFPVEEIKFYTPNWVDALACDHAIRQQLFQDILECNQSTVTIRDVNKLTDCLKDKDNIMDVTIKEIDLGKGIASLEIDIDKTLFYRTISEQTGFFVEAEGDLLPLLVRLARVNDEYMKIEQAINDVNEKGYGIVLPKSDELRLEEPEIVKQGGKYGVKLRASAPSIHMLRADIQTEVAPIVGNEKQSEELVHYMLKEFEGNTDKLWESNIFGKSLHELVSEGLSNKLKKMPDDAQGKLRETLERIINEGSGGLICIIL